MQISRRQTIGAILAGSLTAAMDTRAQARPTPLFNRTTQPLGIQLYMLGNEFGSDRNRMFTELARAGYRRFEADWSIVSQPDVLEAAHRHGLSCNSVHINPMGLGSGEGPALEKMAAAIAEKGIRFAGAPIFPFAPSLLKGNRDPMPAALSRITAAMTVDDWHRVADLFNRCGAIFRKNDLRFFYHNHNVEFRPLEGTTPFELLLQNTDPTLVSFELDVGWAVAAGHDPLTIMKKHQDRFRLMHIKDIASGTAANYAFNQLPTTVGSGIISWHKVIPAARAAGISEFFVEQEPPFQGPRINAARLSAKYLLATRA